jgi:hypothetical protein
MVMMDGLMRVSMGMRVGMRGMVVMTVNVGVGLARTYIAPQKQATPQGGDDHARDAPQPGI